MLRARWDTAGPPQCPSLTANTVPGGREQGQGQSRGSGWPCRPARAHGHRVCPCTAWSCSRHPHLHGGPRPVRWKSDWAGGGVSPSTQPPPGLRQDHGPAGARGLGGRPGSGTRGPCTHLPGLQLEPQAQLRVVNGTVVPELCQRQPEVRQGLLEPVGVGAGGGPQRPREGPPAPAFFLPPPQLRGQLPGQQWSPRSQHEVGTQVQTKGSRGQHAEVAAS